MHRLVFTAQTGPSWLLMLLPYLEQQGLYSQFNFNNRSVGRFNLASQSTNGPLQFHPLPLVKCPSDPRAILNGSVITNYLGVAGGGCPSLANCGGPALAECQGGAGRLYFNNGIMYKNSRVRMANVTDGMTNVYFGRLTPIRENGQESETSVGHAWMLSPAIKWLQQSVGHNSDT